MKKYSLRGACTAALAVALVLTLPACKSGTASNDGSLPRAKPGQAGVDPAAIEACIAGMTDQGVELHSFMLVKDGNVIAERWFEGHGPDIPHEMYSVSKTVTSMAVGYAVDEGLITVDDKVISFFPDKLPAEVSDNLRALTVENLLTMSVGHDVDAANSARAGDADWVEHFLSIPVDTTPGTVFSYNSMATYMLSAIIQRVTGQKVLDYLAPRLFGPLAIEGIYSRESPQGIQTGGWGNFLKTEDMAKIGLLLLNEGTWNGEQIFPAVWVRQMSSAHIDNTPQGEARDPMSDWHQGYGYQVWRCTPDGVYRADGAHGQFIVVMPRQNSVVVMTAGGGNMQHMLDMVWKHLLPELS